jgi:hypothetical protein
MALADTLSEAEDGIEHYLRTYVYDPDIKAKAREVLRVVRQLRVELDTMMPQAEFRGRDVKADE